MRGWGIGELYNLRMRHVRVLRFLLFDRIDDLVLLSMDQKVSPV